MFGGDPDKGRRAPCFALLNLTSKVTIFGESGGAFLIDTLLTSYGQNERPPFRGAILQGGQASYPGVCSGLRHLLLLRKPENRRAGTKFNQLEEVDQGARL